ncbi:hypothetical protein [Cohnella cholangitidis]|uniref:Uncharacterized protein n=1 Tax=Cohnella cholangitidis TaxID=2598458 RepID=A0A7G5BTQ4_9BACL|nr:hypothetical protein [Cohnella cholangitidis]QMV40338.1 hypothetical protein FPL14_03315 [Cohnella cholangitidis]
MLKKSLSIMMFSIFVLIYANVETMQAASEAKWNRTSNNAVTSGNVKKAVSLLKEKKLLQDVTMIPEEALTSMAKYYGGSYYLKATFKRYEAVTKNSTLYKQGIRYKFYFTSDFKDFVVFSTSENLPVKKEELKADSSMIITGYFIGKEIIDHPVDAASKKLLAEYILEMSGSKNKALLRKYLADGKIDKNEASHLNLSDSLLAATIVTQLNAMKGKTEESFALVSNSANIHPLNYDILGKIKFKNNFENDFFVVDRYIAFALDFYYMDTGLTRKTTQKDVDGFFNSYGKALGKIEWFQKKYPDKWATAKTKWVSLGIYEGIDKKLAYLEEARKWYVDTAITKRFSYPAKYDNSLVNNESSPKVDKYEDFPAKYKEFLDRYDSLEKDFVLNNFEPTSMTDSLYNLKNEYTGWYYGDEIDYTKLDNSDKRIRNGLKQLLVDIDSLQEKYLDYLNSLDDESLYDEYLRASWIFSGGY